MRLSAAVCAVLMPLSTIMVTLYAPLLRGVAPALGKVAKNRSGVWCSEVSGGILAELSGHRWRALKHTPARVRSCQLSPRRSQ